MTTSSHDDTNSSPTSIAAKRARRRAVVQVLVVLVVIVVFSVLGLYCAREVEALVNIKKSEDNLKAIWCLMMMYANNNGNMHPSMQPRGSRKSGGVRDLYPLYQTQSDKKNFLKLLQPPGMELTSFSDNPGPDEFDSQHIGYGYNSIVVPQESSNPPLMWERGAEDGMLQPEDEKRAVIDGWVLLANGDVRWMRTNNLGTVIYNDIKPGDIQYGVPHDRP